MKTGLTVFHLLLALILSVILVELLLPSGDASAYEQGVMKGKEISRFFTFLVPGTLVVSAGWQLKKPWLFAGGLAFIAGLLGLIFWLLHEISAGRLVSEDEKKPLVRSEGRLCQAAAGFSLRAPGPGFLPNPEGETAAQNGSSGEDSWVWVLSDPESGEVLLVRLYKDHPASKEALKRLSHEMGEQLAQQIGGKVSQQSLVRSGQSLALGLIIDYPAGPPLVMRCVSFEGFLSSKLICAHALTYTTDRVPDLLTSLNWLPCGSAAAG